MTNQCEIVQDLLPLYIDQELSKESHVYVESHLATCKECGAVKTELLKSKQFDLNIQRSTSSKSNPSPQELDFINRITKWKRNSAIFGVCFLLLLTFLLWMFIKEDFEPQPVDKEMPIEKETTFNLETSKRWGNINYDNITVSDYFNNC
jgi:predicted anti-sigma-YlaC factor YlaD